MLPIFVQLLSHPDAKIQFETAWALTNVASTEHTRAVVECGAVSKLVELLMSGNADVREQSAWCIGNIAGEGADLRDMVLQAGAMNSMIINIQNPASDSLLANVTWALSNLCRGKPQPDLEVISPAIPYLCQVVASGKKDAMQESESVGENTGDKGENVQGYSQKSSSKKIECICINGEDFSHNIGGLMAGYFRKTDLWLLNPIEIRNLQPVGKLYISYL